MRRDPAVGVLVERLEQPGHLGLALLRTERRRQLMRHTLARAARARPRDRRPLAARHRRRRRRRARGGRALGLAARRERRAHPGRRLRHNRPRVAPLWRRRAVRRGGARRARRPRRVWVLEGAHLVLDATGARWPLELRRSVVAVLRRRSPCPARVRWHSPGVRWQTAERLVGAPLGGPLLHCHLLLPGWLGSGIRCGARLRLDQLRGAQHLAIHHERVRFPALPRAGWHSGSEQRPRVGMGPRGEAASCVEGRGEPHPVQCLRKRQAPHAHVVAVNLAYHVALRPRPRMHSW